MIETPTDACLLERFARRREEAAFAALERRHGPRVRAACKRVLGSDHDAEDVAQATFLMLALKADELPWRECVGGWLCAVAHRLSLNARAGVRRRLRHESLVGAFAGPGGPFTAPDDPAAEAARRDLTGILDHELARLPEKFRDPVVLCDLEGLTHEEAADRLGLPRGSMSRRLQQARTILRRRLAGRGVRVALLVGSLTAALFAGRFVGKTGDEMLRPPALVAGPRRATHAEIGREIERLLARILSGDPAASAKSVSRESRQLVALWSGDHEAEAGLILAAADDLERPAGLSDDPTRLAAARRFAESCASCHTLARQ